MKTFSSAITASAGINTDTVQGITSANFALGNSAYIGMLHLGVATPSTTNYAIFGLSGTTYLNATGGINFRFSNSDAIIITEPGGNTLLVDFTATGFPAKMKWGYTDLTGSPGTSGTGNTATGRFILTATNSAFVLTNSLIVAGTVVFMQAETAYGTALGSYVVCNGSCSYCDA